MISVPQLRPFVLSTARPLMPLDRTVLVRRALPAQISTTSKSCKSMPEKLYETCCGASDCVSAAKHAKLSGPCSAAGFARSVHVLTGLSKRILLGAEPGPWCQALGLTDLQVTKL